MNNKTEEELRNIFELCPASNRCSVCNSRVRKGKALLKSTEQKAIEKYEHRLSDLLAWYISKGHIEMKSINLEQLLSKLKEQE